MTWVLLALLLACKPDPDDTGDTGDTADTGDTDTDSGDTSDTGDTADTAVCPDADGDGYCDAIDDCDGPGPDDADGDGTCDGEDPCFGTGADSDSDGVCDNLDDCQGNDATGDVDADGTCDDLDACYGVGADADADGLCDDVDLCVGDNTTGDDDGDAVCDGSDPCVGPAWCWNLSLTITSTPQGSGFDNLIGQTLSFSLGVGDDDDWTYGGTAVTHPDTLSKSGSNADAQQIVDLLDAPSVAMSGNGTVFILWDPAGCSAGENNLSFIANSTGWTFGADTVSLAAGTKTASGELVKIGTCPGTLSEHAAGTTTFVAIDGFGPP